MNKILQNGIVLLFVATMLCGTSLFTADEGEQSNAHDGQVAIADDNSQTKKTNQQSDQSNPINVDTQVGGVQVDVPESTE